MSLTFAITFDYLCPFARNANEFVLTALAGGTDFAVTFTPFSLSAGHAPDGSDAFFADPKNDHASGIQALLTGLTVRDQFPEHFAAVHRALFAARHDAGQDLKDTHVITDVLTRCGVDADAVLAHIATGTPKTVLTREHHMNQHERLVWGVPTFTTDARTVFVRLMDRPTADANAAAERIRLIVNLVDNPVELHEFKQVDLPQ